VSRPPVLCIDIGSSAIHAAIYDGEWRDSPDLVPPYVEAAVMCSVVPATAVRIQQALLIHGLPVYVLGENLHAAMPVRYRDPAQLGQDRLAAAVAAYGHVRGAVVVVDAGTAITVDAVSAEGEFLGGAIAPGPQRAWEGVRAAVEAKSFSAIPDDWLRAQPKDPVAAIGRSTREGLEAGWRIGFAGLVDRLIREQRTVVGREAPVIWTGGAVGVTRPLSEYPGERDDLLVLKGLLAIYEARPHEP
jgi:type III pantothenate kinase